MDSNKSFSLEEKKFNVIDAFKKFIAHNDFKNIKELSSNNERYLYFLYAYAEQHMKLYLKNYNKKAYRLRRRNLLYIKKLFNKTKFGYYKYSSKLKTVDNIIVIYIFIFAFIIFLKVLKGKKGDNKLIIDKYKQLDLFNRLLSNFLHIVGNFYSVQIIKEEYLESLLKFLIILSIASQNNNLPNMNDNIINMMFLVQCITIIKKLFNKIYKVKNQFNEKQKAIINNIIIFIKDNIIGYSNKKPFNIINKIYLSQNDYNTTSLMRMAYIVVKTKDNKIIKNYIELLSNIYIFSFSKEKLMSQFIKVLEPLFLNIDKKYINEIDSETDLIHFIIDFIENLIEREKDILQNEPLLREGFFFGNKVCGISSEIDTLEDEFSLIFGFCLYENKISNTKKEWTMINIRSKENKDKEKVFQLKIWLSKINNSNHEYNLMISDKNQNYNTDIKIKSQLNYVFAFNFVKNKTVKISYINDDSGKIYKIKEINLKFNINDTYIYLGCDIKKNNIFEEQLNTFFGRIGTLIILNNKKMAKKGDENIDLILQLKGDYASSILMSLKDNDLFVDYINDERKYHFVNKSKYFDIINRLTEIYEAAKVKFVEVIRMMISPYSFKLLEYKDEIDYLGYKENYKIFECVKKKNLEARQNYLNLKQKTNASKSDIMVKLTSSFFNSRYNIFENKYSLEEFIKYDGIYYLSLLLEYTYQILCKIEKEENKKLIQIKIKNTIFEILKFFCNNLINKYYFEHFYSTINEFFYQMTVTLKKYITTNIINKEILDNIFDMINQFIEKILNITIKEKNPDVNLENKIRELKSKFLGFLHDIFIFYKNKDYIYPGYISIISNLLTHGKLNDLYTNEFIDEFVSFTFIFELSKNYSNLVNIYEQLLYEILKYSFIITKQNNRPNEEVHKISYKKSITKISEDQKEEKNNPYFDHFLEQILQKDNSEKVFPKLLNIIYNLDLVKDIKKIYIEKIQSILLKNYKREDKKAITEPCLKILLVYSLSNKEDEEALHHFLKKLTYYKGFFFSVVASIKQIKYLSDDNKLDKNEMRNLSYSSEQNSINETKSNSDDKNERNPLLNMDLNNLSKRQNRTLIKLLQDCISMLFIKDELAENEKKVIEKIGVNEVEEIYSTLKNNLDAAFKVPGKIVYKEIFNSESQITSELFFFKWKKTNNEKERNILFEDIKKYHDILLQNHGFPFIFKLLLLIDLDQNNTYYLDIFIVKLLMYMINEFDEYYKKQEGKIKEGDFYYINNLINFVVLIDRLFLKKEKQFYINNQKNIEDIFFKLIDILKYSGLLYSNYCFEIGDGEGKIISEICYDIFISLLNYNYKEYYKDLFIKTFIINDKQLKKFLSLFYLMDLNKEEILKKEKKIKKEVVVKYLENSYTNLKYIHENFFEQKIIRFVFGKKFYKIEEVNFSMYFLVKTFIYKKICEEKFKENEESKEVASETLNEDKKEKEDNKKVIDLLKNNLQLLSMNLFELWTKHNIFYGHKRCSKFLSYKFTKEFFESHAIQSGNDFTKYEDFFNKDIHILTKGQYKIENCYSSRLLDRNEYDLFINEDNVKEDDNLNSIIKEPTSVISSSITSSDENQCFLTFDKLEKKNIILNPKNYYLKIRFSYIFNDFFFKDKKFQKIKYSYVTKFRTNIGLDMRTKQLEYPTKEKNFSNSLEPKSFLRRDYNFYEDVFLPISHEYIENRDKLINKRDNNKLFFYKHVHKRDIKGENKEDIKCELITTQYLYFGRIILHKDYIYFKTEKDPRDKEKRGLYSEYIFSTKDIENIKNENSKTKGKELLIFFEDIREIIRKRTLLMMQSLEIYCKNGKSFFFNCFQKETCDKICNYIKNQCNFNIEEGSKSSINNIIQLFKKGKISNYEYLLYLNKLSTRSFNDLSQYPVFPWIIKNICKLMDEEKILDLKNINNEYSEKLEKTKTQETFEDEENDKFFRNMKYPISMQSPSKRETEMMKFKEDSQYAKYPYHLGTHYSTSSYIFYYLMRINPYSQNMIQLQNYRQENPNRMFLSFGDTQKILETSTDNRELIPDLFCYIDYFCNLNCSFLGLRAEDVLVDDFNIYDHFDNTKDKEINNNIISTFVKYLYVHKKILNDVTMKKGISQWVDIIFGKKQFPEKKEEKALSCNIFGKLSYEQCTRLDVKLEKYKKKYEKELNKDTEKKLLTKIQNKINIINNFGACPCQILTESVFYEENIDSTPQKKSKNSKTKKQIKADNFLYFFLFNDKYFSVNENSKENSALKRVQIYDINNLKKGDLIVCGNFETNLYSIYNSNNYNKNYLYKTNYVISLIQLNSEILVLTCRYLGNYFKVQNLHDEIKIICEDFVTTIVSDNADNIENNIFYTGLRNGKLIKWKLIPLSQDNQINTNKKKNKSLLISIEEINHIYDHKKSITAIEINNKKEIIATSGEDKFIHIRKLYDLEILTVINLTYCYGNQIISRSQNIFPSMIKISDLNVIYVLFFDFDSSSTFIRGYTLNGLFFAQTENNDNDNVYYFNNMIINKNGNVIVGLYNQNKILKLNSFDLKIRKEKILKAENQLGTKWIEYDSSNNSFITLYDEECTIINPNEEESKQSKDK